MKKWLLNYKSSQNALDFGLLILRVIFGLTMFFHGYDKLIHFNEYSAGGFWNNEVNLFGLGGKFSLGLVVFAEFFCALFLVLGLFTRFATIVLILCMAYAILVTHKGHVLMFDKEGKFEGLESAFQYIVFYVGIFLTGPGRFSLDKLLNK